MKRIGPADATATAGPTSASGSYTANSANVHTRMTHMAFMTYMTSFEGSKEALGAWT
jgi:hypothetical protein